MGGRHAPQNPAQNSSVALLEAASRVRSKGNEAHSDMTSGAAKPSRPAWLQIPPSSGGCSSRLSFSDARASFNINSFPGSAWRRVDPLS